MTCHAPSPDCKLFSMDIGPGIRLSLSPDGKRILYPTYKVQTRLWMLEGFRRPGGCRMAGPDNRRRGASQARIAVPSALLSDCQHCFDRIVADPEADHRRSHLRSGGVADFDRQLLS